MRIVFRRQSDQHHALTIEVAGRTESMRCETRSYLLHDLLHYAVESEAALASGFWGALAAGRSLAELAERAKAVADLAKLDPAARPAGGDGDLLMIEKVVGVMHGATKGVAAGELFAGVQRYGAASGTVWPAWLTLPFIEAVIERMRHLRGRWAATPFGEAMVLEWPAARVTS